MGNIFITLFSSWVETAVYLLELLNKIPDPLLELFYSTYVYNQGTWAVWKYAWQFTDMKKVPQMRWEWLSGDNFYQRITIVLTKDNLCSDLGEIAQLFGPGLIVKLHNWQQILAYVIRLQDVLLLVEQEFEENRLVSL